jgi:hypothetical protein
MADPDETLFQYLCRHGDLVKAREDEAGSYPGDGPTADQVDALIASLRPLSEETEPETPALMWAAFKNSVDTEMTWLFPERDPISQPMTAALRQIQDIYGKRLEQALPEQEPELHRYVDLALVANAANRQVKLRGNGINWRLVLARFMYWLGGGKRS